MSWKQREMIHQFGKQLAADIDIEPRIARTNEDALKFNNENRATLSACPDVCLQRYAHWRRSRELRQKEQTTSFRISLSSNKISDTFQDASWRVQGGRTLLLSQSSMISRWITLQFILAMYRSMYNYLLVPVGVMPCQVLVPVSGLFTLGQFFTRNNTYLSIII